MTMVTGTLSYGGDEQRYTTLHLRQGGDHVPRATQPQPPAPKRPTPKPLAPKRPTPKPLAPREPFPAVRFPVGEPIVETPAPEPVIGADAAFVFEGGGMRGLFTAGVIDVLMEHGVTAGLAVGVSAGVTFGCNFKSLQIGRPRRYNERYCADHRYASLRNLITTGDLYSRDFAYGELPWTLDPLRP